MQLLAVLIVFALLVTLTSGSNNQLGVKATKKAKISKREEAKKLKALDESVKLQLKGCEDLCTVDLKGALAKFAIKFNEETTVMIITAREAAEKLNAENKRSLDSKLSLLENCNDKLLKKLQRAEQKRLVEEKHAIFNYRDVLVNNNSKLA